ncbi:MAG: insulinase family protein [Bacteroides sp.]|nr:insulinase family protein [Bacteroides sp.]
MAFRYSALPNGLRLVMRHLPDTPAETCGLAVNAGSRDEGPGELGLAHFVEHTVFKGTLRRRAWHINNRMEAVGGELNAYTTREETFLYSTFPSGGNFLDRATELIADLVANSCFPKAEIDREREVVLDEIMSYLDTPSEGVFDEFDDLIYAGTPLGHNILGTPESVAALTPEVCRSWLSRLYVPSNMVFFYSGPLAPERVERIALRHLGMLHHGPAPLKRDIPPVAEPFSVSRPIGTHQAHTVTGARIPGLRSDSRTAMALAVNVIGGPGMNSLLNVALREKRGLVYSIDASTALLTDTGLFTVYYGCDPDDTPRCRRIVADILRRMATDGLDGRRLDAAKRQLLGQIKVAGANAESVILSAARATLHLNRADEPHETVERIMSVTPEALRSAAAAIAPELTSTLTLL